MGYLGSLIIYLWKELAKGGETMPLVHFWLMVVTWETAVLLSGTCLDYDIAFELEILSKCISLYFKSGWWQQKFAHAMTAMAQYCLVIYHVLLWSDWSSLNFCYDYSHQIRICIESWLVGLTTGVAEPRQSPGKQQCWWLEWLLIYCTDNSPHQDNKIRKATEWCI